jgi:chemotaxis-related protein WspD
VTRIHVAASSTDQPRIDDCWNRIGVQGDRSCPELAHHAHCQSCPSYRAVASELLRELAPDDYAAEWTSFYARPQQTLERGAESVVIFRVEQEWLALPTSVVTEITNPRPIHSLPHRRNGIVLGLANIRGELLVCASLKTVLRLDSQADEERAANPAGYPRFLVIRRDGLRTVCPVDDVQGVEAVSPADLKELPATIARSSAAYSHRLLNSNGRSVGVLDAQLLLATLKRSFA